MQDLSQHELPRERIPPDPLGPAGEISTRGRLAGEEEDILG